MTTYHLAPDGSDSNDGSERNPWYSIGHAGSSAGAGDTVVVAAGTYEYSNAQKCRSSGTSSNPLTIRAAEGATPVVRFGGSAGGGWGAGDDGAIRLQGNHITLDGLDVRESPYYGISIEGDGCTVRNCKSHGNHLVGITAYGADDCRIEACEVYDNYGSTSSGGDSDGIQLAGGSNNGTVVDCVMYYNGDDGIDLWGSSGTVVRRSMAYNNGRDGGDGNGFKMGGDSASGNNSVEQCLAWQNRDNGFDYNTATPLQFYHCTSWDNGGHGFAVAGSDNVLYNNIAYQNASGNYLSNVTTSNNSWELGIRDPRFADLATDGEMGHPQNPETFLRLADESPCIGAGTSISGFEADLGTTSPDLGAYQFEAVATDSGVYYHDGSGWRQATLRHHDGSGWQEATLRHHDGNQFA